MAYSFSRTASAELLLTLSGDIDLEVTPDIKNQLTTQANDARALEIDARNVTYIDSSGISLLVIALQLSKQRRIPFTISAVSTELMRVVNLARLDKLLPIDRMTGPADPNAGITDAVAQNRQSSVSDADLIADLSVEAPPEPKAQTDDAPQKTDGKKLDIKPGTFG